MGEKRTLNLVVCEEKKFDSGKVLYKLTTQDGQHYDCWDAKIKEHVGKGPQEYEVFKKEKNGRTDWYIDLGDSKGGAGSGGKWGGGGRGAYVPNFSDTREAAILRTKAMVLSYAKDLEVTRIHDLGGAVATAESVKQVELAYEVLLKLLDLGSIPKDPSPSPASALPPPGTKSLAALVEEIKAVGSVPVFATWWDNNQAYLKVLTGPERVTLYEAKEKKLRELDPSRGMPDAGEIPF